MEKQITGKEVKRYIEHLVKLLHKEWERSGRTKAEAIITLEEAEPIYQKLAGQIVRIQETLEEEKLTFQQSMVLTKESFTLLRLVKKIKKEEEKTNKKGVDIEFAIELDSEEYGMFCEIALARR